MTPAGLRVASIGDAVPHAFAGRVLAVFEHARTVTVASAVGGLVSLVSGPAEAGPAGIQLVGAGGPALPGALAPRGTLVCRSGDALTLGGSSLPLGDAPTHRSDVRGLRWAPGPRCAIAMLSAIQSEIEACEAVRPVRDVLAAAARRRVAGLAAGLALALEASDVARVRAAVAALVGLGPGATPSGDDALVGILLARALLSPEGPGAADARGAALRKAVRVESGRTTDVSRSYLLLACEGRFTSVLRDLARALCDGDVEAVRCEARRCARTGHTSGIDGLLGLVGALRAASGERRVLTAAEGM